MMTISGRFHHLERLFCNQKRSLHLLEHQAKSLLQTYGVAIQPFQLIQSTTQVSQAIKKLNTSFIGGKDDSKGKRSFLAVVKAQCEAGGRGKGYFPTSGLKGGVHLVEIDDDDDETAAKGEEKIVDLVSKMLGNRIVTAQTDESGVLVESVSIARALDIQKERYFAILLDSKSKSPVIVGSAAGGMEIEGIPTNERLVLPIERIDSGPSEEQLEQLTEFMRFTTEEKSIAIQQMRQLYRLFVERDAIQLEINPFASTQTPDEIVCFDAKITIDDNAAFRQQELFASSDKHASLGNYCELQGNIGCLVNGAGLAMATLDLLKELGGEAANFLDIGGNASTESIKKAFELLAGNSRLQGVFVNVFGGIVRCDAIAQGIVEAVKGWNVPIVVRLAGTAKENAIEILRQVPQIQFEEDLLQAATKIVYAVSERQKSLLKEQQA